MTNRVYVILHLFSYRLWMMLILLWERKSCRVRYSLREMKIKVIKDYSEEFELMDTWRQWKPEIHCFGREYPYSYKTNNNLVTLNLLIHPNIRGPGFLKLNTSCLTESENFNLIKLSRKLRHSLKAG